MPGECILETIQKIATAIHRLDALAEDLRELRTAVGTRLDRLEGQLADVRERLARLEASRDADRAQMHADLSRFKAEIERAELRLTRLLQSRVGQPPLPVQGDQEI
jgi:septal ring factor EnvC (AmiA/AmiB activator)